MTAGSPTSRRGRLFVLSGPSGVGKDAVLTRMKDMGLPCHFAVTATTRRIRPGEREGIDYRFMSKGDFRALIASEGLLEWAEVYGNLYGIPRSQVIDALDRGQDVVVKIDVQGSATVRRLFPEAVLVFLEPPEPEALLSRLRSRNTESEDALSLKLETAFGEMKEASWFDHRVVNEDGGVGAAAAEIASIIRGERE